RPRAARPGQEAALSELSASSFSSFGNRSRPSHGAVRSCCAGGVPTSVVGVSDVIPAPCSILHIQLPQASASGECAPIGHPDAVLRSAAMTADATGAQAVLEHIDAGELVDLASALIRIPSFKTEETPVALFLEAFFRQRG